MKCFVALMDYQDMFIGKIYDLSEDKAGLLVRLNVVKEIDLNEDLWCLN